MVKHQERAEVTSGRTSSGWRRALFGSACGWALSAMLLGALSGCPSNTMSTGGGQGDVEASDKAGGGSAPRETRAVLPAQLLAVELRAADSLPANAPPLNKVSGWLKGALLKNAELSPDKSETGVAARVRGSYRAGHEEAGDGSGQILGAVFFELSLVLVDPKGREIERYDTEAFIGEALKDVGGADAGLKALVMEVSGEVAEALVLQARVRHTDDEALVKMLDPARRRAQLEPVIREVRKRKVHKASAALIPLLKHEERDIVNLSAGALGDVGTREAVPALIDSGTRAAPADRLPVLYALGQLGGPQAVVYLETLHKEPNLPPALRQAVEQALEQARRQP